MQTGQAGDLREARQRPALPRLGVDGPKRPGEPRVGQAGELAHLRLRSGRQLQAQGLDQEGLREVLGDEPAAGAWRPKLRHGRSTSQAR